MNVPTIEMSIEEAETLYEDYSKLIKQRGDDTEKYLKELKSTYYHLSQGRKVIDIFEVFKKSGTRENGDTYLGLARADWKKVVFHKQAMGAGTFTNTEINWSSTFPAGSVDLPGTTFPTWATDEVPADATDWQKAHPTIARRSLQTKVPIIPVHILPEGKLDNYYILFEVVEGAWTELPTPPVGADPYLLKRINSNCFVVLAEWDVTDIEQAVMRG